MSAPSNGMKGSGIANVPGAWYDVGGHIDSAAAVISSAADYFGTLPAADSMRANHVASLIEAASELLRLAKQDVDRLEQELKAGSPDGAPVHCSAPQRDVDRPEAELKGIRRDDPNTYGGAA